MFEALIKALAQPGATIRIERLEIQFPGGSLSMLQAESHSSQETLASEPAAKSISPPEPPESPKPKAIAAPVTSAQPEPAQAPTARERIDAYLQANATAKLAEICQATDISTAYAGQLLARGMTERRYRLVARGVYALHGARPNGNETVDD